MARPPAIFPPAIAWTIAISFVLAGPAAAGGDPDAARSIVAEHCVTCHEVPGFAPPETVTNLDAPPFSRLARDHEKYPPERLRRSLRQPHWPMVKLILSRRDIDNLLAFIGRLAPAGER